MWWCLYFKNYVLKFFVLLLCVLPVVAAAADFTVTPLALNYDVGRRDIIEDTITVTNTSDRLLRLYASVHEVSRTETGVVKDFAVVDTAEKAFTPSNWVEITRGRLELAPGEKRDIPFTIRMHPHTEAGEYSVFVGLAAASNQPKAVAAITAGDGQGSLLNITVDKKQSHQLRLESFQTGRFVSDPQTHTIEVALKNPGTVQTVPQGEVIFYDTRGHEVAATTFNNEGRAVTEQATETFSVSLPDTLPMGKYKAFLDVSYGDELRATLQDTAFFYVINVGTLATVFVSLLLLTLLVVWLYVRRQPDADSAVALYVQTGSTAASHNSDVNLKDTHD